uniref:Proteasome activator complex subunit 4B n=1 Tax=Phallusia mammillata TaxID=59560 RepID=A0A6F9DPZ3_9ASCI|nr:proteasome activator complex subunit 4B [Phallusia mammillata]
MLNMNDNKGLQSFNMERCESTPQTEVVYNKHLPYSDCIIEESNHALSAIKTNLLKAVFLRDLRPGVIYWTSQLTRYIRLYGLKFTKEDHVLFVKLFYELITLPHLEGVLVEQFANILVKLLKKRELLTRSDVTLDWKPLHKLSERLSYSKMEPMGLEWIPQNMDSKLRSLIRNCRSLFPPETTRDMLDEWRPLLCPYDIVMGKGCLYLDLFLPTLVFDESQQNASWKLWIEEFLTLWKNVRNGPSWEKHFVNLFARLAHNNIGLIDWRPVIDTLFTRVLRSFQLPVGKLQHTTALAQALPMDTCCLWIVSMFGGPATECILKNLKCLIDASESYFHPSNHGRWVTNLSSFLQQLTVKFSARLFRERHKKKFWEPKIPESHLIRDEDIEAFVEILKPVTVLMLYGKLGSLVGSRVLQILAFLKPESIVPLLLEKTYIALETLTEPHQARACLSALSSTLGPGIHGYPEIRNHIIPLLLQCLPAIDPNDLPKSMYAFQFISTCMSLIPVVDCSEAVEYKPGLSEDEKRLCYSTSGFKDFALQFLDRCFMFLESLSQEHGAQSHEHTEDTEHHTTTTENLTKKLLVTSASLLLQQSSLDIYSSCLKRVFEFSTNNLLEGNAALSTASSLFAATVKANPSKAYALFIPHFCELIIDHFQENVDAKTEEKMDKKLLWDVTILCEICYVGTEHLLTYKDSLLEVVQLVYDMKVKQGYMLATNLLKNCLIGWSTFYITEHRSVSHSFDEDPKTYLALDDWGATTDPWKLEISWHVPSKMELEACFDILDRFISPHLDKLKKYNGGLEDLSKEDLRKILKLLHDVLAGCYQLLPVEKKDLVDVPNDSPIDFTSWPVSIVESLPYYKTVMQQDDRVGWRHRIFEVVRKTLQTTLKEHEDDVKAICQIVHVYSQCALMHEGQKALFDQNWKVFSTYKTLMSDPLHKNKRRTRHCLVDRTSLQHSMRVLAVERSFYTNMHHSIMMDLIDMSTSHYMKVRQSAQSLFFHGLGLMPSNAYKHYLPVILKNLDKNQAVSHQKFKGSLYLLLGKMKSRQFLGYLHNWDVIRQTWPALIDAPHSDKLSVAKLYEKLAAKIQTSFNMMAIDVHFTDSCMQAAVNLFNSDSLPKVKDFNTSEATVRGITYCEQQNAQNRKVYLTLVNDLADLYDGGKLTWKHAQLVLGMLSLLLRYDIRPPTRIIKLYITLLLDDTLSIRRLAVACVASIMKQLKRNHVVLWKTVTEITSLSLSSTMCPGDRPDNAWHQFNSSDLPLTKEKFENTVFIDKTHWGYYCWPKHLKTYAPFDKQPKLNRSLAELDDDEVEVQNYFMDPEFVEKLIEYFCLENEKGKDKFDSKRMDLFRGLFRNFGDVFVPLFRPHIERLVQEKQETHQRCAAEIITGMVMGSKHWDFEKVESMWQWVIPVLRTAVANISSETMKDWDQAFGHLVQNRDPRRIHWVLRFLVEESETASPTALVEGSKLYVLQGGIHQQEWRVPELMHRILKLVECRLGHPYKNIRNRVGCFVASVFLYDIKLLGKQSAKRTPEIETLIASLLPKLESLLSEDTPPLSSASSESSVHSYPSTSSILESLEEFSMPVAMAVQEGGVSNLPPALIEQIQNGLKKLLPPGSPIPDISNLSHMQNVLPRDLLSSLAKESKNADDVREPVDDSMAMSVDTDNERSENIRIFKSILKWIVSAQRSMLQPFRTPLLKLLPVICKMYPVEQQAVQAVDEELHRDTRLCLSCFAQSLVQAEDIPDVLQAVENISTTTSWHARYSILPYIQVFVYSNLFAIQQSQQHVKSLESVIFYLLKDEQYEVCQMASVTLSGLIQCGVMKCSDDLLKHAYSLCRTRLKSKKQAAPESVPEGELQKRLLKRHSGVLILSACVLSSPYSVTDWMPQVLMKLSEHLHDPQPIQGTVQKTLSEFKRTHHDNWHEDKLKFSSDELATLTDLLVSPSYYA